MGFHPQFHDRGVYPAITTLVLIAIALIAGGLVWIVVGGQSSSLSRNVDVEIQSKNLVFAHNTSQFSVTLKNTGTVRIDDARVELREIPSYPALRVFDEPSGGGGAVGIPISNVQELQDIQDDLDNDYYLTQDIDASETRTWHNGKGFNPIGTQDNPFTGTFDGNGHIIENLYIGRNNTNNVGLFGQARSGAIIENVGLRNENIHGENSTSGLIGYCYSARVSNCYSTGEVYGTDIVGGLVGWNYHARVTNCHSTSKVCGANAVGGLAGCNYSDAQVTNCYSTGEVCSTGAVGGLVGRNNNARVNNSFWDVETSGQSSSMGGYGKTTMEMKTKSTFTNANWNFTDTWRMGTEVITLNMGSISPGKSVSASKTFVAPISSGKTYLVEVTAFDSNNNAILRETTTVIAGR